MMPVATIKICGLSTPDDAGGGARGRRRHGRLRLLREKPAPSRARSGARARSAQRARARRDRRADGRCARRGARGDRRRARARLPAIARAETPARVAAIRDALRHCRHQGDRRRRRRRSRREPTLTPTPPIACCSTPSRRKARALPAATASPSIGACARGFAPGVPWLLSGGLDAGNVAEAIALTGARGVDVSSGVESAPGVKDVGKIAPSSPSARARAVLRGQAPAR